MKLLPAILLFVFIQGLAEAQELYPCDQNGINQALQNGGEVYLNAGVYEITGTINIHSNTVLTGSPDAIIRVSPSSSQFFTGQVGIICNPDESLQNVEICGFQIDGNIGNLPRSYDSTPGHDRDCEKLILFGGWSSQFGNNISIHDMVLHDSFSDAIYIRFTDGVHLYNNFISDSQHEGFYLSSCRNGSIYNNKIAGICSDNGRLDNCQDFLIKDNVFFSYSGPSYGAHEHGENSLQIGNQGEASHGYTPTAKPFTTLNIEVTNNTFVSPGLQAFSLSGGENVYIHGNIFKDASELETLGVSVGNYSYERPPTLQQSQQVFSSIFDILNTTLYYSAITGQSDDSIQYTVQKTTIGNIAGGVKIIGFRNQIVIDNRTYMQDKNSTIVKSAAGMVSSLDFLNQGIEKIDKDIHVEVKNGTATATMTVTMKVYSVSYSQTTKRTTKTYNTFTSTYNDTAKAPQVFPAPQNIKGRIEVYPTFFEVYVPSDGLVKIDYNYGVNVSTHSLMRGEREFKDNVQYTEYTRLDDWSGELNNTGEWCFIYGAFDKSKLHVTATTPYQDINVTNFDIDRYDYPKDPIAFWFYPTVGFLICLYFIGRFFWRNIWG